MAIPNVTTTQPQTDSPQEGNDSQASGNEGMDTSSREATLNQAQRIQQEGGENAQELRGQTTNSPQRAIPADGPEQPSEIETLMEELSETYSENKLRDLQRRIRDLRFSNPDEYLEAENTINQRLQDLTEEEEVEEELIEDEAPSGGNIENEEEQKEEERETRSSQNRTSNSTPREQDNEQTSDEQTQQQEVVSPYEGGQTEDQQLTAIRNRKQKELQSIQASSTYQNITKSALEEKQSQLEQLREVAKNTPEKRVRLRQFQSGGSTPEASQRKTAQEWISQLEQEDNQTAIRKVEDQRLQELQQRQTQLQERINLNRQANISKKQTDQLQLELDQVNSTLGQIQQKRQLENDLQFINTRSQYRQARRALNEQRESVLRLKGTNNLEEKLNQKKADIAQREIELRNIQQQLEAQQATASTDVTEALAPLRTTRAQELRYQLADNIDQSNNSLTREEIDKILNQNNPLQVLGLDQQESITTQEISNAYQQKLAGLFNSPDPRARQAMDRLQQNFDGFINGIQDNDNASAIQEKALFRERRIRNAKANFNRAEFNRVAGVNQYENTDQQNLFSVRDWMKDRRESYYEEKKNAIGWLVSGGPQRTAKQAGNTMYQRNWLKTRNVVDTWSSSRPGSWVNQRASTISNWTKEKKKRVTSYAQQIDKNTAAWILNKADVNVTFRKYAPGRRRFNFRRGFYGEQQTSTKKQYWKRRKKKKSGIRSLMAIKALYDVTIGRTINTIKNVVGVAKDFAYSRSGAKFLNTQRKIVSSRISTSFWSSRAGKAVINIQRGLNGVRAATRALGSGTRASLIAAGALALSGASLPTVLTVASVAGVGGVASKLIADTLASKTPHFMSSIQGFQQRFGVLGSQKYLAQSGMLEQAQMEGFSGFRGSTSRLSSLAKSVNWGTYGMSAGLLIGTLVGANPLLAGAAGLGIGLGARYGMDRIVNRLTAGVGQSQWMQVVSKMPFFEAMGLFQSIPWLNSQINGIIDVVKGRQSLGDFLKQWAVWKSPVQAIGNYMNVGFNIHNTISLGKWASGLQNFTWSGAAAGTVAGTFIGTALAMAVFGLPLTTALVVGGISGGLIGGIIGGGIGSALGPIGTIVGSGVGSAIGSFLGGSIGGFFDKLTGSINLMDQLLGALSFMKGLLDFMKALGQKFNPIAAFGMTMTLVFSAAYISDIEFMQAYKDTSKSIQESPAEAGVQEPVLGVQDTKTPKIKEEINTDCLLSKEKILYNPEKTVLTRIKREGDTYTVITEDYTFTNFTDLNDRLEVYGTISTGQELGTCF